MSDQILTPGVVVAGSFHTELVLRVDRLPEWGRMVPARGRHGSSGGRGLNQAVAAARVGAAVRAVGCVGDDAAGISLLATLARHGIDSAAIRVEPTSESGLVAKFVDGNGASSTVVAAGANAQLTRRDVEAVATGPGDVLVAQGELGAEVTESFLASGKRTGATTVLNLAPFIPPSPRLLAATTILVVNDAELLELAAWCVGDAAVLDGPGVVHAVSGVLAAGPDALVLTLGSAGAVLVTKDGIVAVPGEHGEGVEGQAGGDVFTGVFAAELARGTDLAGAVVNANRAISLQQGSPAEVVGASVAAGMDGSRVQT